MADCRELQRNELGLPEHSEIPTELLYDASYSPQTPDYSSPAGFTLQSESSQCRELQCNELGLSEHSEILTELPHDSVYSPQTPDYSSPADAASTAAASAELPALSCVLSWLLNLDKTCGRKNCNSLAWVKLFTMNLIALVSREWHEALMAVTDTQGDPAGNLFLWGLESGRRLNLEIRPAVRDWCGKGWLASQLNWLGDEE